MALPRSSSTSSVSSRPRLPRSSRSSLASKAAINSLAPSISVANHGHANGDTQPAHSGEDQPPSSGSIADSSSSPHSVASPNGLSRVESQPGYFDTKPSSAGTHQHAQSPLPAIAEPDMRQAPRDLLPEPRVQAPSGPALPQPPSSLSPPARPWNAFETTFQSPLPSPTAHPNLRDGNLSRSASADAAGEPPSVQAIRRLTQQNRRIREAWEAERKYMEANRERVEEVYKEERVIMEDERSEWEAEKDALFVEIRQLKQRVSSLESDNIRLQREVRRFELEKAGKFAEGISSPSGSRSGGDGSTEVSLSRAPRPPAFAAGSDVQATGSDIDGRSKREPGVPASSSASGPAAVAGLPQGVCFGRPQVLSPGGTGITSKQPEASLSIFLDRNMQPLSSPPTDFLGSPKDEEVPIIDIKSVHPGLDGIALRAPAIQKETFTDSGTDDSKSPSLDPSPPSEAGTSLRRHSSRDQTLEALTAPPPARLTLHAGHTPSHSLSHLPTAAETSAATVAGGSGSQTPTLEISAHALSKEVQVEQGRTDGHGKGMDRVEDSPAFELEVSDEAVPEPEQAPVLQASDDPELKGPLMVRNIPAHDEVFFRRLSEKLEDVSRGHDASPYCLQEEESLDDLSKAADASGAGRASVLNADADASSETHGEDGKDDPAEIPLKLRKTTNFGAPLGTIF